MAVGTVTWNPTSIAHGLPWDDWSHLPRWMVWSFLWDQLVGKSSTSPMDPMGSTNHFFGGAGGPLNKNCDSEAGVGFWNGRVWYTLIHCCWIFLTEHKVFYLVFPYFFYDAISREHQTFSYIDVTHDFRVSKDIQPFFFPVLISPASIFSPKDVSSQGSSEDCWRITHHAYQQASSHTYPFNTYPVNTYRFHTYPFNTYPTTNTYPFNAYPFKRYARILSIRIVSIRIHSIRIPPIHIHSMRVHSMRILSKGMHQQEWQCM